MATLIARLQAENPILTKELRTRMRGARAFWIIFTYLAILSAILFVTYFSWWQNNGASTDYRHGEAAFVVGRIFYMVMFGVQAVLVALITPALTAGGISIEKEQRTFELLSVSLLPRRSIVLGKLTAAVSFVVLLLTASLPLISLGFLLGGISPGEVATAYLLLVVTAFLYGAVGMACSSVAKSTSTSTVMAFGTIIFLFFVTLPLTMFSMSTAFFGSGNGSGIAGLSALNPIGAMLAGTVQEHYFGLTIPAWLTAMVLNGLLGLILTTTATHRMEYPRSDRSFLLRGLVAGYVGLLAFGWYGMMLSSVNSFSSSGSLTILSIITIIAPCLLVPIFTTGEGLPKGGIFSLLDLRRLRKGEAPSGLVYVLLLGLLCCGIFWFGAQHSPVAVKWAIMAGPIRHLSVLVVATVWFFGSAGLLISALIRNRWSAFALTMALMLLLYIVPNAALVNAEDYASQNKGNAKIGMRSNALYLTPITATLELSEASARRGIWKEINPNRMIFGSLPLYNATPILYGVLGLLFMAGAQAVHTRTECRSPASKPSAVKGKSTAAESDR